MANNKEVEKVNEQFMDGYRRIRYKYDDVGYDVRLYKKANTLFCYKLVDFVEGFGSNKKEMVRISSSDIPNEVRKKFESEFSKELL